MVAIQWQERLETANEAVTGNKRGGVGVCSLGVHMCYSIGGGEWGAGYQLTRLDTHVEEERERQKERWRERKGGTERKRVSEKVIGGAKE